MSLLDEYLKQNKTTRYRLTKISGIPETTIRRYATYPLNKFTVLILRSISIVVGKTADTVLKELEILEMNDDDLNGFRTFLNEHHCSFPDLELELYQYLLELKVCKVNVLPFTFNRFDDEYHADIKADCKIALENAISMLEEALNNVKNGNAPVPQ